MRSTSIGPRVSTKRNDTQATSHQSNLQSTHNMGVRVVWCKKRWRVDMDRHGESPIRKVVCTTRIGFFYKKSDSVLIPCPYSPFSYRRIAVKFSAIHRFVIGDHRVCPYLMVCSMGPILVRVREKSAKNARNTHITVSPNSHDIIARRVV